MFICVLKELFLAIEAQFLCHNSICTSQGATICQASYILKPATVSFILLNLKIYVFLKSDPGSEHSPVPLCGRVGQPLLLSQAVAYAPRT